MIRGMDVALYFLSLDKNHELFNKTLRTQNGRKFYEGNARLNKYMHLAQNIYIAKYEKTLMDSVFYAYDNGAVNPEVQENYSVLLNRRGQEVVLEESEKSFLDAIYKAFYNATLDELIELSHEDSEWIDKYRYYQKEKQKMDSMARKEEYAEQYADMIKILERMGA
ncbi:MAG: Panacea domain-containing protein [Blautia sp.]|nr:Panacea domain-containing protein [Blautia sp.]